jgi:AraC-like DNA-binding protein
MQHVIKKYPVKHPILKNYIKFFWSFQVDQLEMNHTLIPQRNINLRFNLSDTPHFLSINGNQHLLEKVYFSGIHDHFTNAHLKLSGCVDTLGICFYPEGFYPFLKIPVSEFKNQLLGAGEVGYKLSNSIRERLITVNDIHSRLEILECELINLLIHNNDFQENFSKIFAELKNSETSGNITDFCKKHNICLRNLERMFNKNVGVSASTFSTLNRFHNSLNRLLYNDFSRLSDLAYDNGYFDQMHFIKDFKRFTGNTPKSFVTQSNSILQIGKLT